MSAKPRSRSRLRLALFTLLGLVLLLVLVAGALLHWDDQLRLLWQEQRTSDQQRAASVWLPDYELVLEARLPGSRKMKPPASPGIQRPGRCSP